MTHVINAIAITVAIIVSIIVNIIITTIVIVINSSNNNWANNNCSNLVIDYINTNHTAIVTHCLIIIYFISF